MTTTSATSPSAVATSTMSAVSAVSVPGTLRVAAIASLGAGAIHATAAGTHSEHRSAVLAFVGTAVLQVAWGALALNRHRLLVGMAGIGINGAAIGGWLLAKTSGITFVTGLEEKEAVQFADALAAGLAAVAVLGAFAALVGLVERRAWVARPHPALVGVAAVATIGLAVPGMVGAGSHSHADGTAAGGHDHGAGEAAAVEIAKPYDATLPVDLGGVPGVSAEEQREAEELVTVTLQKLPQFDDIPTIEAMGYRSIGDAASGYEHFEKWDLIHDGRVLDPDYPESLVFEVNRETGEKRLAAAMFKANPDDTLETVPDVGGDLVQWHIHNDLCWAGDPGAWVVAGVAPPDQECPPGTRRLPTVPMAHVWIVPHECGPFAALEGVGAGQIAAGEERLCDHAHGAPA